MITAQIPLPGSGMSAFSDGIDSMIKDLMEKKKLAVNQYQFQTKQKQLEDHFQKTFGLSKDAAGRAAQAAADNHRIALNKLDPTFEARQYEALENYWRNKGNASSQQSAPQDSPQMPVPQQETGEGLGVFTPEGMQEAQQQPQTSPLSPMGSNGNNMGGPDLEIMKQHPMLRGWYKHHYGIDPLSPVAESPEQKRALNLQSKIDLENIKAENKAKALGQKELLAVRKDLPTLEKSLKGVDELMRIAKSNPDMFGHGFMPDRFAKTTKIKDFGKWQNLISDAIAGLEQKLSARGNVVALKLASSLKPSHAEQQDVAIGKLESMRGQLIDAINNSKAKTGQSPLNSQSSSQYNDNDLVVVEGPNGDETMTYAQAKALGAK